MQKTFTNNTILNIMKLINSEAGETLFNKKIPITISFAIQYNLEQLTMAYNTYQKTLFNLADKYEIDLDADAVKIKESPGYDIFNTEAQTLLEESVEVDIRMIKYSDLEKCDSAPYEPLTTNDIGILYWLIEED